MVTVEEDCLNIEMLEKVTNYRIEGSSLYVGDTCFNLPPGNWQVTKVYDATNIKLCNVDKLVHRWK